MFTGAWLFVTLWITTLQAPLSMGFPGKNAGTGCSSFSSGSFWPRDRTCISCMADSLPLEPSRKPGFPGGAGGKRTRLPRQETQERRVPSLGLDDPLEKEMATHSTMLAWEISWTEEPPRVYSPWGCKELNMTEAAQQADTEHWKQPERCGSQVPVSWVRSWSPEGLCPSSGLQTQSSCPLF